MQKLDAFERALERMHYLTDSQMSEILENCGFQAEGREADIMKIMMWRDQRGDFMTMGENCEPLMLPLLNMHAADDDDPMLLPLYMENVTESTLQYGLLKPDLQLECLLRTIPYEGSDTKSHLISKLMHFKDTLFSNSNTFQLLDEQARASADDQI